MKIVKQEVVTRYHVVFTPLETKTLQAHADWQHVIGSCGNSGKSQATLSKVQINAACDVLGVNGREFMAQYLGST